MSMITREEVLAVDGGLRYILHRYPQADGCVDNKRGFKIREGEKSASAKLKKMPDGKYGVTDFGNDGKMMDAIQVAMIEDGIDFPTAIKAVAAFYDIAGAKAEKPKPAYDCWTAKPDEQDGATTYETKELTTAEIRHVLVEVAWRALHKEEDKRLGAAQLLFAYYHLKSVKWKRFTTKGITHQFSSTDQYPIFIYEEGEGENKWGRFYEPRAEKKDRFRYIGPKPKVFIHGLEQAKKKHLDLNADKAGKDYDDMTDAEKKKAMKEQKIPEIINCSGGSDAINTAALGYQVIWRNSESEEWTAYQFSDVKKLCVFFYNLPDIDATGIAQGHKLALQFLDMKTIWLPERMLEVKDTQGRPVKKDLRDYLGFSKEDNKGTYGKNDFKLLVETALPYEFWDMEVKLNKDGEPRMKSGRILMEYKPNNLRIYNFLYRMGYYRLESDKTKEGHVFVHVQNNIVREIEPSKLEGAVYKFLDDRFATEDLRNAFYRSPQMNSSSLSKIPTKELDFKAFGPDYQYLFFLNTTWRITAKGIEEMGQGVSGKYVWEDKILKIETRVNNLPKQHKAKKEEDFFKVQKTATGDWDVEILRNDCVYLNFLQQTCRVHWREELENRLEFFELYDTEEKQQKYIKNHALSKEDVQRIHLHAKDRESQDAYKKANHVNISGDLLTKDEQKEQQHHLANRLYVIGYTLHRWKFSSRPWAVWTMDSRLSEEGESFGGSGKSLVTRALKMLLRVVPLAGRSEKLTENGFMLENVTKDTDLVLIDDAHQYLDFGPFFEPIATDMVVNRKNVKSIVIPYLDSPKFWFNSNYGDKHMDSSSQRRKIYTVFSDYYHKNANGEYREDRNPKDDFGMDLFDDFDAEQQNLFYNLMAQCIRFYLSCESEVRAPGQNVTKRNLMAMMGDNFKGWADVYFSTETSRLDADVVRDDAQEAFYKSSVRMSSQSFLKKLGAWCKLYGYILNPEEMVNDKKRIIKNVNGSTREVLFICTTGKRPVPKPEPGVTSPIKFDDDASKDWLEGKF